MKLSISNIAWAAEYDDAMYSFLSEQHFDGIEIAPTRIFPSNPYERLKDAARFAQNLKEKHNLAISSIQSLWYKRTENIFASAEERSFLLDYTKKAVLFANAMGCGNLVFGSPRNRNMPSEDSLPDAMSFFKELGNFANKNDAVIAFEPVPPSYNTNFINSTQEAFDMCKQLQCNGLKVNVDLGTMIYNDENMDLINSNIELVNHIHISEPMLARIEKRELHKGLKLLNYNGYISIEMRNLEDIELVKDVVVYVKSVLT